MGAVRQGLQRKGQCLAVAGAAAGWAGRQNGEGHRRLPDAAIRPVAARHPGNVDDGTIAMSEAGHDDIVLRLEEVSKVYSGIVAVKRANLELHRGAVNVLVGENGAGKSTLMKI